MVDISAQYLSNLLLNGLLIGVIYGLMALGLTLIFSVLGIVSFAHGEFYMIGGYVVYFVLQSYTNLNPYFAVLLAGLVTVIIGFIAERLLLQPMAKGEIERPGEYAILITFGLAFFLQFLMVAIVGPFPKKAPRFFDLPVLDWGLIVSKASTLTIWGIPLSGSRLIAGATAVVLIGATIYFMARSSWY
jgi:branched-chain amino acid transport system permease protein